MKKPITLSIAYDVIEDAKKKGINISDAAQLGIMKSLNMKEIEELAVYPDNLAIEDPDNFYLSPVTGKCQKKGSPQFFQAQGGKATPITKEEYLKKLQIAAAHRYDKPKLSPRSR